MSEKDELFKKFKTMSKDDLMDYHTIGKSIDRVCSILGIGLCFTIFAAGFGILGMILSGMAVFILADLASGACETVKHVEKNLERFGDK